jgi:hypothetical protein
MTLLLQFSGKSSAQLIKKDRLTEFYSRLGYPLKECPDGGYETRCPRCGAECFVGVHGRRHPIFWKCRGKACPTNSRDSRTIRDLLGFVRECMPEKRLGTAKRVIEEFLNPVDNVNPPDAPKDSDGFVVNDLPDEIPFCGVRLLHSDEGPRCDGGVSG